MILLLGATGYLGQAFARELRRRGECFIPLSRSAFDYTRFDLLFDYVRRIRPELVINAAGFSGRPNMDACEVDRMRTFKANTLLPQTVARVCSITNTPLGHVSSGCIYTGAKVILKGEVRLETDLSRPELRHLFEKHPEAFVGFSELDEPNFSFRSSACSFLAGTKALAEESLKNCSLAYCWRHRIPFNEIDSPCNLLTKLQTYPRVYDHITSLSHLDDYVRACLDLVEMKAPYGIYNVVNSGATSTRHLVELIRKNLKRSRKFQFWASESEFYSSGAKAPRSVCVLDNSKLLRAGVRIRSLSNALSDALERWQPAERTQDQPAVFSRSTRATTPLGFST